MLLLFSFLSLCSNATAYGLVSTTRRPPSSLHLQPQQLGVFERIERNSDASVDVKLENWLCKGCLDFEDVWDAQKDRLKDHLDQHRLTHRQSIRLEKENRSKSFDTILLLQHKSVLTLGTASDESFILNRENSTVRTIRMDRGGEVTYHGPGQLVVYPILDLRQYRQDLHWYMRALEQAVIQTLHKLGVVEATRDEETTGVWVRGRKVASIGVKCRSWVTQHGVAINVEREALHGFEGIVPCGLEGRSVACVNDFMEDIGPFITVDDFARTLLPQLEDVFSMHLYEED
jgi:lipoyl(octanoyl) transferase